MALALRVCGTAQGPLQGALAEVGAPPVETANVEARCGASIPTPSKWPDAVRRAGVPNARRYFYRKTDPSSAHPSPQRVGADGRPTAIPPPRAPIVAPPAKKRMGGPWDLFISHRQADTGRTAALLEGDLRERRYKVWLDVKMRDCSLPAMMHGVEHSRVFLLVLSDGYFSSDYCRREVLRAIDLQKPIVLAHREGIDVGCALRYMDTALKGQSAQLDAAVDDIKSCTSIQLVVSDSVFAKTTVDKIIAAAGLQPTRTLNAVDSAPSSQANLRRRIKAIASSLQLDEQEHRHMADVLDRAMETLCIRTEVMEKSPPFHERVQVVEQHLGL